MLSGYFVWWYTSGVNWIYRSLKRGLFVVVDFFSLPEISKNLLAPWKNDVLVGQNLSLGDTLRLWQLNLASRLVGFFVRAVVLAVGLTVLALQLVASLASLVVWLAVPVLYIVVLPLLAAYISLGR